MKDHEHEHEHAETAGVKVSDRRHFTESGERRPGVDAVAFEAPPPPPPAPAEPAAAPKAAEAPAADAKTPAPPKSPRLAAREITFGGLVQDLYATCAMQLGADMGPGQPPGQIDLEGARETIDLIALLQEKTHGNLDPQEEKLLGSVLFELRRAYVEVQRAATSRVQPPPRR